MNFDFVLTVNTWPVIRRLCFFVMLEAKSIRAGLFRGYPDKTRIWGLKGIKRKLKWYSLIKIVLYLFWFYGRFFFFFGGGGRFRFGDMLFLFSKFDHRHSAFNCNVSLWLFRKLKSIICSLFCLSNNIYCKQVKTWNLILYSQIHTKIINYIRGSCKIYKDIRAIFFKFNKMLHILFISITFITWTLNKSFKHISIQNNLMLCVL